MDDTKLAQELYDIVGPSDNITKSYNCMTRLRFYVKDEHFTKEQLAAVKGVLGVNKSGDEWQVIVGPGKATHLAKAFQAIVKEETSHPASSSKENVTTPDSVASLAKKATVGDGAELHEALRQKNATPAKLALKKISQIFVPIIPAFIACGLIAGIVNIVVKANPALTQDPVIQILAIAGNAAFWGLNIFVGMNAASVFGGSPALGGVMAAILSHPNLSQIVIGHDTALVPGRGGIIAVILVVLFSSWLEKKIAPPHTGYVRPLRYSASCRAPFYLRRLIYLSTYRRLCIRSHRLWGNGIYWPWWCYNGIYPGRDLPSYGHARCPSGINSYSCRALIALWRHDFTSHPAMAGGGQVGASLAVYVKTKNKALRRTIASAIPVGLMGIGEPLIYGVTLPLGKPFIGACLGGAVGGAVEAAYMVGSRTLGISGLPLAPGTDNIPIYLAGLFSAYVVGFIATWIIGFDDVPN